jgi:hypothetical protein
MKEQIKEQIGTCKVCHEKYLILDLSGRCESCFEDPTESEYVPNQYEAHPFQPAPK